jgi:DNA-binding Lrp family transcriptional regulator
MAARRPPALDRIDVRILAALQRDGRSTVQKLAGAIGLSSRACLERVRRLEAGGIIIGYQAIVDIGRLSKPVTIFAEIVLERLAHQNRFEKGLTELEEVVECWQVSGTFDYLARFVCADVASYEALTNRLIDDPKLAVARIVSHIALRPVRLFRGFPESLLSRRIETKD